MKRKTLLKSEENSKPYSCCRISDKIKKALVIAVAVIGFAGGAFGITTGIIHATQTESEINYEILGISLNSEDQIRRNCKTLGVNYNDLNMLSAQQSKPYKADGTLINDEIEGPLNYRSAPSDGSTIKVIVSDSMLENLGVIQACVDEINYIGEHIDDPVKYEVVREDSGYEKKLWDIEIRKDNNCIIERTSGHYSKDSIKQNGNWVLFSAHICIKEESVKGYGVLLHELNHAVVGAKDIYQTKGGLVEVSSIPKIRCRKDESYYVNTISNSLMGKNLVLDVVNSPEGITHNFTFRNNFSAGDILLRAAKYSPFVEEKRDEYIKFAAEYEAKKLMAYAEWMLRGRLFSLSLEDIQNYRKTHDFEEKYQLVESDDGYLDIVDREKTSEQTNDLDLSR